MGRLYEEFVLKEEESYGNTSIISSVLSSVALIIGAAIIDYTEDCFTAHIALHRFRLEHFTIRLLS